MKLLFDIIYFYLSFIFFFFNFVDLLVPFGCIGCFLFRKSIEARGIVSEACRISPLPVQRIMH